MWHDYQPNGTTSSQIGTVRISTKWYQFQQDLLAFVHCLCHLMLAPLGVRFDTCFKTLG